MAEASGRCRKFGKPSKDGPQIVQPIGEEINLFGNVLYMWRRNPLVSVLSAEKCGAMRCGASLATSVTKCFRRRYTEICGGVRSGKSKFTFRVRCIQSGSATSPRLGATDWPVNLVIIAASEPVYDLDPRSGLGARKGRNGAIFLR